MIMHKEVIKILQDSVLTTKLNEYSRELIVSSLATAECLHGMEEVYSWLTQMKTEYELFTRLIDLSQVQNWVISQDQVGHQTGKYFSVIGIEVQATNREVTSWYQPVIQQTHKGILGFVVKEIRGVLHFLAQAKVEPGNLDIVEIAPTVQCITDNYDKDPPPFLEYMLEPEKRGGTVCYSALQSEEGGRFFREENRNMIVWVDERFAQQVPERYIWLTLWQLKYLLQHNNEINVEARSLIASL